MARGSDAEFEWDRGDKGRIEGLSIDDGVSRVFLYPQEVAALARFLFHGEVSYDQSGAPQNREGGAGQGEER